MTTTSRLPARNKGKLLTYSQQLSRQHGLGDPLQMYSLPFDKLARNFKQQVLAKGNTVRKGLLMIDSANTGLITPRDFCNVLSYFVFPLNESLFRRLLVHFRIKKENGWIPWDKFLKGLQSDANHMQHKMVHQLKPEPGAPIWVHVPKHRICKCGFVSNEEGPLTLYNIMQKLDMSNIVPGKGIKKMFRLRNKECEPIMTRSEFRWMLGRRRTCLSERELKDLLNLLDPRHTNIITYSCFAHLFCRNLPEVDPQTVESRLICRPKSRKSRFKPKTPEYFAPVFSELCGEELIVKLRQRVRDEWATVEAAVRARCHDRNPPWIMLDEFRRILDLIVIKLTDGQWRELIRYLGIKTGRIGLQFFLDFFHQLEIQVSNRESTNKPCAGVSKKHERNELYANQSLPYNEVTGPRPEEINTCITNKSSTNQIRPCSAENRQPNAIEPHTDLANPCIANKPSTGASQPCANENRPCTGENRIIPRSSENRPPSCVFRPRTDATNPCTANKPSTGTSQPCADKNRPCTGENRIIPRSTENRPPTCAIRPRTDSTNPCTANKPSTGTSQPCADENRPCTGENRIIPRSTENRPPTSSIGPCMDAINPCIGNKPSTGRSQPCAGGNRVIPRSTESRPCTSQWNLQHIGAGDTGNCEMSQQRLHGGSNGKHRKHSAQGGPSTQDQPGTSAIKNGAAGPSLTPPTAMPRTRRFSTVTPIALAAKSPETTLPVPVCLNDEDDDDNGYVPRRRTSRAYSTPVVYYRPPTPPRKRSEGGPKNETPEEAMTIIPSLPHPVHPTYNSSTSSKGRRHSAGTDGHSMLHRQTAGMDCPMAQLAQDHHNRVLSSRQRAGGSATGCRGTANPNEISSEGTNDCKSAMILPPFRVPSNMVGKPNNVSEGVQPTHYPCTSSDECICSNIITRSKVPDRSVGQQPAGHSCTGGKNKPRSVFSTTESRNLCSSGNGPNPIPPSNVPCCHVGNQIPRLQNGSGTCGGKNNGVCPCSNTTECSCSYTIPPFRVADCANRPQSSKSQCGQPASYSCSNSKECTCSNPIPPSKVHDCPVGRNQETRACFSASGSKTHAVCPCTNTTECCCSYPIPPYKVPDCLAGNKNRPQSSLSECGKLPSYTCSHSSRCTCSNPIPPFKVPDETAGKLQTRPQSTCEGGKPIPYPCSHTNECTCTHPIPPTKVVKLPSGDGTGQIGYPNVCERRIVKEEMRRKLSKLEARLKAKLENCWQEIRLKANKIDPDGFGIISGTAFRAILEDVGIPVCTDDMKLLLEFLELSPQGPVNYLRFLQQFVLHLEPQTVAIMGRRHLPTPPEGLVLGSPSAGLYDTLLAIRAPILARFVELRRELRCIDKCARGWIHATDFRKTLQKLKIILNENEFFFLMEYFDPNLTGHISYNEFLRVFSMSR